MLEYGKGIETVGDLIKVLETYSPELKITIQQPRSWVKKQPDNTHTSILSIEVTKYWLKIKTHI